MAKNLFNPVMGLEEQITDKEHSFGAVYFTKDTRKIYLDTGDRRIPMGGNISLFYGKMKPAIDIDGETEFDFKMSDIIGNDQDKTFLIPNVNDLILNNDGCFYKVGSISGEGIDTILTTEKLTIAGTGGGDSTGGNVPGSLASFSISTFYVETRAILQGGTCPVRFIIKSTNDVGEYETGEVGYYELLINNKPVSKGSVVGIPSGESTDDLSKFDQATQVNTIDIAPYLPLGATEPVLKIYDRDGRQKASRKLPVITVSSMSLIWNYDNKTINYRTPAENEQDPDISGSMTLEWKVTGAGLKKTTYLSIEGSDFDKIKIGEGTQTDFSYELNFKEFKLLHGAYSVQMWAEAEVGINTVPTEPEYRNIIVANTKSSDTIISVCLYEKELTQYNTIAIPVHIYNKNNTAGTATVSLLENNELKDKWIDVPNLGADIKKSVWNYTPTITGDAVVLTVQSGGKDVSKTVAIQGLDLDITEKAGYAFKFKASEFSSDTNVQDWKIQGRPGLIFSEKFDWINGGLNSEEDGEGGHRQFMTVKAGSQMTINYPILEKNASANGKHLKIIFKATNCRNYDAPVLSCKIDKKVIRVDKTIEHFLLNSPVVKLVYGKGVTIDNDTIILTDIQPETTLDVNKPEDRKIFDGKYVQFGNDIYQCAFIQVDPNNPNDVYNTWYKTSIEDSFNGLMLNAQYASFRTNNAEIETQYCEDTYIELEIEVTAKNDKRYIKFWIDGVPCGYVPYPEDDRFILEKLNMVIGSSECDVQIYLIKLYESELTIPEHMNNFYIDAPNAEEMVRRYRRNDIMDDDRETEINMFKLAKANPNCLIHHYEAPHMPTTKKDETYPCKYTQYKGSDNAKYYANNVMIKVQGTSSEKYVLSAANLDTDFQYRDNGNEPSGIIDGSTHTVLPDGWSMDDGTAIPINFACTKVNVASCENINNALNQEWYNLFQPYKSVLRCKNAAARDTMQFTDGVMFITDNSSNKDDPKGITNNVFADTSGYIEEPYPKFYSLAQMGNSKNNVHVFHDISNPLECCVEVADNQMPQQWMINDQYNHADIGKKEKLFEFRYPDENASQTMIDAWNDFVSWMAHANPQPRYNKFENITTDDQYNDIAINKKTFTPIEVFILENDEYKSVTGRRSDISTYYTLTDHIYGYTNLPLSEPKTYEAKTFTGFIAQNQKREDKTLWQKDYVPLIQGCTISKYAGTYERDTYEYRMAKMLDECEDHLIMDSVLYHYLFIERHCMIDNVAKNTFWSTEDCQHWGLMKDYDNDTADGNDNQGKFTRSYGMEPTDDLNPTTKVFNAYQSVWFNFCHGLEDALQHMYNKLEKVKKSLVPGGEVFNVWDSQAYLAEAARRQKIIPERCWIEDYQRKYFRPNEVYNDAMFNGMLAGGQKKYQRKQYEIYQDLYMSSKYRGINLNNDYLTFRPTGAGLRSIQIPSEVYSDCYIYSDVGGQIARTRAQRNRVAYIGCPVDELGDATMYIFPGSNFTKIGSLTEPGGQLGTFAPKMVSFSGAKKLRELVYATKNNVVQNPNLIEGISFAGNNLLEKLYIANLGYYNQGLDLSECPSLLEVNAENSTFKSVVIANGAPVRLIHLYNPTSLKLSNLTELTDFAISDYSRLQTLKLHNIDTKNINFSKNILINALNNAVNMANTDGYVDYHLTDVRWSIDDKTEMENTIQIKLLDKLMNDKIARPTLGDDAETRLEYKAALTGNLNIKTEAYNDSDPLSIYDNYITDDKFANIDLTFESPKATLYNVIIYDGDGNPFWRRKTVKDTKLNDSFLSEGPDGAFVVSDLFKSPTEQYVFNFLGIWDIYEDKDKKVKIGTINNSVPVESGRLINKDLHIYPQFKSEIRSHPISVKMIDPLDPSHPTITLVDNKMFPYGTKLDEILKDESGNVITPYVSDPDNRLGAKEGYYLKGYSLVAGANLLISNEKYTVRKEDTLWAVFEKTTNMSNYVHPEWFTVVGDPYGQEALYKTSTYAFGHLSSITPGVTIKPISPNMGGKITIPSTIVYNNIEYPVYGIEAFNTAKNLTHVFMQNGVDNTLYHIKAKCFQDMSSLKYFDFANCAVLLINQYAFQNCINLNTNMLGNYTKHIASYAFNAAIDTSITEINLSGSIVQLDNYAFANNLSPGTSLIRTLNIGSQSQKSLLDLASSGTSALHQNSNCQYNVINFWSALYNDATSHYKTNSSTATVANWFVNGGVLAPQGSLFVNGQRYNSK